MRDLFRITVGYWLEILLGIIFLAIGIHAFLLYFLIIYLLHSGLKTDYLRKLIRVCQFYNEIKIMTIMRKLKITKEEFNFTFLKEKSRYSEKDFSDLEKDYADIIIKGRSSAMEEYEYEHGADRNY